MDMDSAIIEEKEVSSIMSNEMQDLSHSNKKKSIPKNCIGGSIGESDFSNFDSNSNSVEDSKEQAKI